MCDALGNPLRFVITAGQAADCTQALSLLEEIHPQTLIADKGYDVDYILEALWAIGVDVVIPPRACRNFLRDYDRDFYKERNLIERMFNKLKHFRRIATRYDKLASTFLSFLHVAAIFLWLK